MVDAGDSAEQQLEVYDTKTGLWHPELGDLTAPDGWEFLPSADAFLARRAKATGRYWTLYQPKGRRAHRRLLGLLAPSDAISAARTAAEVTATMRETKRAAGARQRAKAEVGVVIDDDGIAIIHAIRGSLKFQKGWWTAWVRHEHSALRRSKHG